MFKFIKKLISIIIIAFFSILIYQYITTYHSDILDNSCWDTILNINFPEEYEISEIDMNTGDTISSLKEFTEVTKDTWISFIKDNLFTIDSYSNCIEDDKLYHSIKGKTKDNNDYELLIITEPDYSGLVAISYTDNNYSKSYTHILFDQYISQ